MRVALVYDCLYPHTIGGAERRYRALASRLAMRHAVTYVTRRQWKRAGSPDAPSGVRVVAVSGGGGLYAPSGRRRILPPLFFGWGVLRHLLRHRRDYDVVHVCSFPYFSLLAVRLACAAGGPRVVTDWLEVWSDDYWMTYLGPWRGRVGAAVQRLCIRLSDSAFVLSELHAERLRQAGFTGPLDVLRGACDAEGHPGPPERDPLVVYVGRHIADKRVAAIPAAVAEARRHVPGLRAAIFGDGPEREHVLAEIERLGLRDSITCPGFVPWPEIDSTLRRAMCMLLPSQREGYGLAVIEAAARGTPSVVVRADDNAAAALIEEGRNGMVADSAAPAALAEAIAAVHAAGPQLVTCTYQWFAANAARISLDASMPQIERAYGLASSR
jgi:glycosyltransferase involved in cell wall biosynthesis